MNIKTNNFFHVSAFVLFVEIDDTEYEVIYILHRREWEVSGEVSDEIKKAIVEYCELNYSKEASHNALDLGDFDITGSYKLELSDNKMTLIKNSF